MSFFRGPKRNLVHRDCKAGMILLMWLQIIQKRVFAVYFSITGNQCKLGLVGGFHRCNVPRRRAACAGFVIASASSRMTNFTPVLDFSVGGVHSYSGEKGTNLNIFLVLAKSFICCRTTSIPLSSDAFNWKAVSDSSFLRKNPKKICSPRAPLISCSCRTSCAHKPELWRFCLCLEDHKTANAATCFH